jgi:hypothetical protein
VFCGSFLVLAVITLCAALIVSVALDDTSDPPKLKTWAASISSWWNAKTDRLANCIQDWLIEWDLGSEPRPPKETAPPLPPLDANALTEAMLPEINQLLDAVAEQINDAPNGTSVAAQSPKVRKVLEAWAARALEVGEQLRVDAAMEELPPLKTRHSTWAKKFRRMKAAEGELTPVADD